MMLEFIPETHEYLYEGRSIPSVTQILAAEGFVDTTWYTDHGRDRGKYAHKATELYDRNDLDEESLDPELVPRLEAWKLFLKESGFKVTEIEGPIFNQALQYAGTRDRMGVFPNGKTAVLDLKNGVIEAWCGLQLCAYIMHEPNYYGIERYAVRLKDDGKYSLKQFKDTNDFGIWRAAVSCYWWKRNNLRRSN